MRSSALPKYILLLLSFISLLLAPYQTWAADHQDLDTIRTLAEKGSSEAQFKLGVAYDAGEGVPQDHKQAVLWYTKAAEQGDADAQSILGVAYANGVGVPQDLKQAVLWFTKAAEQGHANAQSNLGVAYANGQGVPQDYKKAVLWYTKAAEQGVANAQYNLGKAYANGQGVPKDNALAYAWESLAAISGDKEAVEVRNSLAAQLNPKALAEAQALAGSLQEKIDSRQKKE